MDEMFRQIAILFPEFEKYFSAGFIVFARLIGFIRFAPIFNRKEINTTVKLSLAFLLTLMITPLLHPGVIPNSVSPLLLWVLNFAVGAIIGYIAQLLILAIESGGDMINTQMGLSSAMVMDPATNSQTSILSRMITLLGLCIFMQIGGMYWLFNALLRSFEIFPIYAVQIPLEKIINLDYLVKTTSNVLYMGLQIASPILLATLGQDIILGVISKTAPQVNVFQLSFLFKPVLGAAIMIWILPMLVGVISDFFLSFSSIY
ncbi:MAG: flagellar biosynthetic protein FliR [bacterium]|nr:flagellar biosynthetic protein FliR [bacterium]